jgi:HlyD family secretion protein
MKVNLSLAEKDMPLLAKDKEFTCTVDAIPDREFSCRLTFLSPTAEPETRSFPMELMIEEPDYRMADGMTVRVEFPLMNRKKSIKVPSAWLWEEDGQLGLFVVENNKAVFRGTTLGSYYEQKVDILSGLSEHELVITNPAGLRSGDSVSY